MRVRGGRRAREYVSGSFAFVQYLLRLRVAHNGARFRAFHQKKTQNLTFPACSFLLPSQDGTLVDSISAVEAAWGAVAEELGQDPDHVIAATHGKRAVDNLKSLKPWIRSHEMDDAVVAFETTILDVSCAAHLKGRSCAGWLART